MTLALQNLVQETHMVVMSTCVEPLMKQLYLPMLMQDLIGSVVNYQECRINLCDQHLSCLKVQYELLKFHAYCVQFQNQFGTCDLQQQIIPQWLNGDVPYLITINFAFVGENRLKKLKQQFLSQSLYQKRDLQCQGLQHKPPSYQQKTVLNLVGVVKLLKNYPNQHVDHALLEWLHELNDLSMLMNQHQINQINGGLNVILHFQTNLNPVGISAVSEANQQKEMLLLLMIRKQNQHINLDLYAYQQCKTTDKRLMQRYLQDLKRHLV
eukprot:TRINITY_DN8901_c0_g1_i5.p4 TRINITY_DN8901_c0_g1~~TRINITY_DN8901_c0_g1_i5.p4  ORF type:complete len:267 (-),score=-4.69 TRINITY_DN8901_c0_g1_i5:483-1283(-)